MDPSTEGYLAFVVFGVALVIVVGQILTRGGKVYLEEVFPERRTAGSVSILLSVMFYLFALGILGVISSISVPVTGVAQTVVTKLGIVLLILGVVFGITMLVLSRIKANRAESEKQDILMAAMPDQHPAAPHQMAPDVRSATARGMEPHSTLDPPADTRAATTTPADLKAEARRTTPPA